MMVTKKREDGRATGERPTPASCRRGRHGGRSLGLCRDRGELAHQGELLRQAAARRLEPQGARVRLPREEGLDVAEILVGRSVVRVETDRLLELRARFAVVAGLRIDRGEVVVRLGELGVLLDELLQDRLRLGGAPGIGKDHGLEESHLRVFRVGGERPLGTLERCSGLARVMQPIDLAQLVGERCARGRRERRPEEQPGSEEPELHR